MKQSAFNILVVSFYFPPYNKVAARRWAKHCKYFQKNNIPFHVLAGSFNGSSAWDKDLYSYHNNITRVQLTLKKRPFHQRTLPENFFEKARWKLSLLTWPLLSALKRGNHTDLSRLSVATFLENARKIIITQNISTVIITVGPFAYSNIIPKLKREFPAVKFVIDYRDYHEDEMQGLTATQIKAEQRAQQEVLAACSLVISPNDEMDAHYKKLLSGRTFVLPHCYDPDDFVELEKPPVPNNGEIKLVYGGAFYPFISKNLQLFVEFMKQLNAYKKASADFYVSLRGYETELTSPFISRQGFTGTKEFFQKVLTADFSILILGHNRVNAMSSKFFELLALRRPIVYFGDKGSVSEFLVKNKLGFHVTPGNMHQIIEQALENRTLQTVPDTTFELDTFTFNYHTSRLVKELNTL